MLHSGDIRQGLLGVFLCLLSGVLYAAEQRLDANIYTSVRYNDNLRLFSDTKDSATGITMQPKVQMKRRGELWDFNMNGSIRAARYASDSSLNNDSVFLTADSAYKTELSRYQLKIRNDDVASLNRNPKSILLDTGVENEQWNRKTQSIDGSWRRQLTEDTDMSLSLGRTLVSYSGNVPANYSGYDTNNGSVSYGWAVTERSKVDASISLLQFSNEVRTFEYDQTIYQLSYGHGLSQRVNMRLSAGKRVLESVFHNQLIGCDLVNPLDGSCLLNPVLGDINTKNEGNVLSISINGSSETEKYNLDLSRTIIPSSVGGAQQQDQASFGYRYILTERLVASMEISSVKAETIEGVDSSRDSEREILNMSLSYKLSKDTNLRFSYQHLKTLYQSDGVDRASNSVSIDLNTAWPRLMSTY